MITGSCLCGGIQYQVDKIEGQIGHCHCSMCRKFHGAAFSTFGEAKPENFRWLKGENLLKSYTGLNGSIRQFCNDCGSSMTFSASSEMANVVEFSLGTLDSDIDSKPDAHIFVENKVNWSDISDNLKQFKQGRN